MSKIEIRGSVLLCPWPVEEQRQNKHHIYLEDGSGKELGSVVALQEPDMFQQFEMMACVIFSKTIAGVSVVCLSNWSNGWNGRCTAVQDIGVATRVHFNFNPTKSRTRVGYASNDCLFRAKNHAQWLLINVDVDEYIFIQVVVIVERLGTKFYDLSTRIQTKFTASLCKGFVLLERFQTNLKFRPCTECQQWNPYNSNTDCAR